MSGSSRFVLRVGDRSVEARVDAEGVEVEGQRFEIVQSGDGRLLVRPRGETRQFVVTLAGAPRPNEGHVDGQRVPFEIQSAAEAALEAALGGGRGGQGDGEIRAPMPGRVVKLLVAEGDRVEADAPVVIVEAMKMENELGASRAGVVAAIHVAPGDAVDAGAPLVQILGDDPSAE